MPVSNNTFSSHFWAIYFETTSRENDSARTWTYFGIIEINHKENYLSFCLTVIVPDQALENQFRVCNGNRSHVERFQLLPLQVLFDSFVALLRLFFWYELFMNLFSSSNSWWPRWPDVPDVPDDPDDHDDRDLKSPNFPGGRLLRAKTFRTERVNCFCDKCVKKVRKLFWRHLHFWNNYVPIVFSDQLCFQTI